MGEIVQVQGRLAAAQLKAGFPVDMSNKLMSNKLNYFSVGEVLC